MSLQNYCATERHFWRNIAQTVITVSDRAECYLTPLPVPVFNYIYLQAGADKNEFTQAQQAFSVHHKPHCLVAEKSAAEALHPQIQAAGYEADGETSAMHLNIDEWQPSSVLPAGCEIREVNAQLALWAEPLEAAFPADEEDGEETAQFSIISDYISYHQRAMANGTELHHTVLLCDGKPVSCITLSLSEYGARIDDLGTMPAHQGNGYATLLLDHALTLCRKRGLRDCYLEASSEGLSLYQKLGFRTLFDYLFYVKG
ncbi:GNAT family N-acetyltransferase [Morganella morganii]|nr:GNAT family N-acetyltransferase [Morganella morganii]EKW7747763.1 GNAT family N-acetyltransferase [Morganella morganii]HCR3200279.1 GNAT family N-acetyltransferase [Morganella morganii]HCR3201459.1 GNAT family N-acetyltransferase [Morganella morganii]